MNQIIKETSFKDLLNKGYFSYLSAIFALSILPVHVKYLPPFMILWVLCWIFENFSRFNEVWKSKKVYRVLIILFVSYYIWQIAGLLYTSDLKMGLLNLFGRLSLVLFPLVLFYPGEMIKRRINTLIRTFALSTFLFMLFCYGYALYRSINLQDGHWVFNSHPKEYPWLNYFYWTYLIISQHPSYVAMYLIMSILICFESWFDNSLGSRKKTFWLINGIFLLISQYFLSSKAGIVISVISVSLYFIVKFNQIGRFKYAWVWIVMIICVITPLVLKNQRVDYLYGRVTNNQTGYERKQDPRVLIWKSALKIARKNLLLGVGVGDVRTELALEYERIGEDKMAEERFNAHNQYLEVLLENGIIGFSIFIAMFIVMFYIAFSDKNLIYGVYILMILMFFLFETMLYRLAGVTFFSLFSFLLIHVIPTRKSTLIL